MIYIKQYGAKRTGTNYIKWLIESNFEDVTVLSNILGWKHGLHPDRVDWSGKDWDHRRPRHSKKLSMMVTPELRKSYESGNIRYSVIVKNPYSYYVSHVRLWKKKGNTEQRAKDCTKVWNALYRNWSQLNQISEWVEITRFEDLIENKRKELNCIASTFGLKQLTNIVDTNKSLRALNEAIVDQDTFRRKEKFDSDFYTKKQYMSYISPQILSAINNEIDKEMMDFFSYKLEQFTSVEMNGGRKPQ